MFGACLPSALAMLGKGSVSMDMELRGEGADASRDLPSESTALRVRLPKTVAAMMGTMGKCERKVKGQRFPKFKFSFHFFHFRA